MKYLGASLFFIMGLAGVAFAFDRSSSKWFRSAAALDVLICMASGIVMLLS